MIPELVVLKCLLNYNMYKQYYKHIHISKELKELHILYKSLEAFHEALPEVDKTVSELESMVFGYYPNMAASEREAIHILCELMTTVEVSDSTAQLLIREIKQRSASRIVALTALEYSEGKKTRRELEEAYEELSQASEERSVDIRESRNFVTSDLDLLEKHTIGEGGLYWPLKSLNLSLGPLRKGDCGLIFARPETGKTTFIAHVVTHMASQATTGPLVWFNNEEQGEKVRVRTFQAALGLTTAEVFRDKPKTQEAYAKKTAGKIWIYDDASITKYEVEEIIRSLNPALVVFDQIDKIKGFDADRNDLVFGKIYQWARELAKSFCPIIGTCQADGTAEGVKWLTMSHVAEAKTSKQAEMDFILGIGKSNEGGTEDVRFFNISKNKLIGDNRTDPELRHGRFDVWIRPQVARYEDILE